MAAYLRQESHRLQLSGVLSDEDRLKLAIVTGEADPLLQPAQYLKEQLIICKRAGQDAWVFFNRQSGDKWSIDWGSAPTTRTTSPELVDVKITNRCHGGCWYCHEESGPNGRNKTTINLWRLIESLAKMRVFEIAIGGGEPTLDVNALESLVYNARSLGIVPNLTTRSTAWLSHRMAQDIIASLGGIAFSIETADEVESLAKTLRAFDVPIEKVALNVIPALVGGFTLGNIARAAAEAGIGKVILLGTKKPGRTKREIVGGIPDWIELARRYSEKIRFGVDTVLASQDAGRIVQLPDWSYRLHDGEVSCYVDAVAGTIAPSSSTNRSRAVPLDPKEDLTEQILAWWKTRKEGNRG